MQRQPYKERQPTQIRAHKDTGGMIKRLVSNLAQRKTAARDILRPVSQPPPVDTSLHCTRMFESEYQRLCREAFRKGTIETGGRLYGLWTPAGDAIVMVAAPPGPGAEHMRTYFGQELEYLRKCDEYLFKNFGLCQIGRNHWHHELGIPNPSAGDQAIVRSMMARNGLRQYVEIIATMDGVVPTQKIAVHAFMYAPRQEEPFRCALHLIPGVSPIGEACLGTCVFPNRTDYEWRFPMERTVHDSAQPRTQQAVFPEPQVPDSLAEEIAELPVTVAKGLRVVSYDNLIMVKIPLPCGQTAYIAYENNDATVPISVDVTSDCRQEPDDVTLLVNPTGSAVRLGILYNRIETVQAKAATRSQSAIDWPHPKVPHPEYAEAPRSRLSFRTCGEQSEITPAASDTGITLSAKAIPDKKVEGDVGKNSRKKPAMCGIGWRR